MKRSNSPKGSRSKMLVICFLFAATHLRRMSRRNSSKRGRGGSKTFRLSSSRALSVG